MQFHIESQRLRRLKTKTDNTVNPIDFETNIAKVFS